MGEETPAALDALRVDEGKLRGHVDQVVRSSVLARLRNHQFFSLGDLNTAIKELLVELNNRPFQKLDGSRRSRFPELDQLALRPLPARAYEYAQRKLAKVHIPAHGDQGFHGNVITDSSTS